MTTMTWEVPEDSDFWSCPQGCGGATEDPYGGPCKRCWNRGLDALDSLNDPMRFFREREVDQ